MKSTRILSLAAFFSLLALSPGCTSSCAKPLPAKRVFFVNLTDNAEIQESTLVQFGLEGMKVRPAGEDVQDKTSGHHHILIDQPQGFIAEGQVVPMDDMHIHYGKGQTESIVKLTPGAHTLSLQLADGAHRSYGEALAATIHVNVVASPAP